MAPRPGTRCAVVGSLATGLLVVLTPERRQAILHIKFHLPRHENIPVLRVYEAVIAHGIRT